MALEHAQSGEVIDIGPLGPRLAESRTTTLAKNSGVELVRLVLPQGKTIPTHQTPGEVTLQCLEGRIALTVGAAEVELTPGKLVCLAAGEPHAVRAIDDSSLLATIVLRLKSG